MKELGDFADRFHAGLVEPMEAVKLDFAVLVGEEMRVLARELGKGGAASLGSQFAFAHCETAGEAVKALDDYGVVGGDAILVKGSNSVGLAELVAALTSREG